MRILVLSDLAPHPSHTVHAANVVTYELIAALAEQDGVAVSFLRVDRERAQALTADERDGEARLQAAGVTLCAPLLLPPAPPRRPAVQRALAPAEVDYVPEAPHRPLLRDAVAAAGADVVLIPWTEWLTAFAADLPEVKFAYYGNPPPKNKRALRDFARAHGKGGFGMLRQDVYDRRFEAVHLAQMRRYDCLGNVAANDAAYYREHGHPNAFYIQNLWIDRFAAEWRAKRSDDGAGPVRIIGNVGKVAATANTHGLEILGRDLLPALRRAMHGRAYVVEILGAGQVHPDIRPTLDVPEVAMRGFVDDIDAEMLDAEVFLCMNNTSDYNVGHTRYLHAWTLGCCVVAHRNAALAMPEIRHGENALLGNSASEIAELVAAACADTGLRRRIGAAGYRTFRDHFTADRVAPKIAAACRDALRSKAA